MTHWTTLLQKKKKSQYYIYLSKHVTPRQNRLLVKVLSNTAGTWVRDLRHGVRAKLGDALCNLVVLPTPLNGYWRSALSFNGPSINQWQTTYRPDTSSPGDDLQMSIGKKILSPRPYGYWLVLWLYKDGWGRIFAKKNKKKFYTKKLKKIEK